MAEATEKLELPADPAELASPPDPREEIERERAERLRLEGENRQLREQLKPPPAAPSQDDLTPEKIEETYQKGEITESHRIRLLAKAEARAEIQAQQRLSAEQRTVTSANRKIQQAVSTYPELRDRQSPLMRQVADELAVLVEEYGMSADDPRTQALAIERTTEGKGSTMSDTREHDRLRRGGGLGGFGGGDDRGKDRHSQPEPKTKGERIFNALLPEFQKFYIDFRGSKDAAIKTLEHADEASLRKAGRMA